LFLRTEDYNAILIASLLFISSAVILGQAYEACKRKCRISNILLFVIFMVTTSLLVYLSIDVYANHSGFGSLSAEILETPIPRCKMHFVIISVAAL
jgi:hypothetical protein